MSKGPEGLHLENYKEDIEIALSPCRKYILCFAFEKRNTIENERGSTLVIITKTPIIKKGASFQRIIKKIKNSLMQIEFAAVKKIYLLSLFGIRTDTDKDTASIIKHDGANIAIGAENDKYIATILNSAENIIFAWGVADQIPKKVFDGRARTLLDLCLKTRAKFYINQKTNNNPLHPFFWTKEDTFKLTTIKDIL